MQLSKSAVPAPSTKSGTRTPVLPSARDRHVRVRPSEHSLWPPGNERCICGFDSSRRALRCITLRDTLRVSLRQSQSVSTTKHSVPSANSKQPV